MITSLLFVKQVHAATNDVNLYLFWGEGCPHCAKEKVFISEISGDFPNLKVHLFEVYKNNQNQEYFKEVGEALGENVSGVPFTVIGDKALIGFNESITPNEITQRIKYCTENKCTDTVGDIVYENKIGPPLILAPVQEDEEELLQLVHLFSLIFLRILHSSC